MDFTQSIIDLLRFRTKFFPGEITDVLHMYTVMILLKSQLHFLHVLIDAKQQTRRALLASASIDLTKAIVVCDICTLNDNHKLTKGEKSKLQKYNNRLRALVIPKSALKLNVNS